MENEKSTGNKYTVKDAAIIGIFCAVMFVVFMVYSTLTGASLFYSMIFNAAGAALILAPFYVYMCMKVGKHGPALVYNIMWAIIAGLMMGPFMIPWFLGGGIIAELSMCGKNAYHDIKRVSISWVITALVRAAHGMSEIWFFQRCVPCHWCQRAAGSGPDPVLHRSEVRPFEPGCYRYSSRPRLYD